MSKIPKGLRPIEDVLVDLAKPIPSKFIKTLQDASKAKYVPWPRINQLLDAYTGGCFDLVVKETGSHGEWGLVSAQITIYGYNEQGERVSMTRGDVGVEKLSKDSYGDTFTSAMSTAFRRAAARFGLGLDLWIKDDRP